MMEKQTDKNGKKGDKKKPSNWEEIAKTALSNAFSIGAGFALVILAGGVVWKWDGEISVRKSNKYQKCHMVMEHGQKCQPHQMPKSWRKHCAKPSHYGQ